MSNEASLKNIQRVLNIFTTSEAQIRPHGCSNRELCQEHDWGAFTEYPDSPVFHQRWSSKEGCPA